MFRVLYPQFTSKSTALFFPDVAKLPIVTALRWAKRLHRRKPKFLPTAPSKYYRIPIHPHMPTEERVLLDDLVLEYFIRIDSLRKLFKDELELKSNVVDNAEEIAKAEEDEHERLMEFNRIENERLSITREKETEEKIKEKIATYMKRYERLLEEEQQTKERVEAEVRKAKEIYVNCIDYADLDNAIEKALDNPVNVNFSVDLLGNITWEGKPPADYQERIDKILNSQ